MTTPEAENDERRKKTSAQKDEIRTLRQEQITIYKKLVLTEERRKRIELRHGSLDGERDELESPRKKKRVAFAGVSERDDKTDVNEEKTDKNEEKTGETKTGQRYIREGRSRRHPRILKSS